MRRFGKRRLGRADPRLRAAVVEELEGRVLLTATIVQVNSASHDATSYNSSVDSKGDRLYLDSQFNTSNIVFTPGGSNTPNVVVSYADTTASQYGSGNSDAGWAYSVDGGSSFNPAYDPATGDPTLPETTAGANPDNVLVRDNSTQDVYYVTSGAQAGGGPGSNVEQIFVSTDNGELFGSPVNATSGAAALSTTDKPSMAIDNNPSPGAYRFFLAYTYYEPNAGHPSGIYIARSANAVTWPSPPSSLNSSPGSSTVTGDDDDGTGGSRIAGLEEVIPESGATVWAPQILIGTDHTVYLIWLEQDSSINRIMYTYSTDIYSSTTSPTWSTPKEITTYRWNLTGLPDMEINGVSDAGVPVEGHAQAPAFASVAINPVNNDIYVAYADWGDSSGSDRGNVYVVQGQNINSGSPFWSVPTRINDDTTSTDQWQPAITVSPLGNEAFVGWYDKRNDPTNNLTIQTWGSIASISGHSVTWGTNFQISNSFNRPEGYTTFHDTTAGTDQGAPMGKLGDYDTASSTYTNFYYTYTYAGNPPEGVLSPAWPFPGDGQSDIQLAVIPIPYTDAPAPATSLSANWVSTTTATDWYEVTLGGSSDGEFTLSFTADGQTLTTGRLSAGATGDDVATAIENLESAGTADFLGSGHSVTGTAGGPYEIGLSETGLGPITVTGIGYDEGYGLPTVTISTPANEQARQLTDLRQAHLAWTGAASGTSVYVQYSTANSSWQNYGTSFDGTLGANGVTLTDVALDPNQTYYFRIRVGSSDGSTSDFIMAGLLNWTADHPALNTYLLSDSGGLATYVLQWTGNAGYGSEMMDVQYSANSGSTWTDAGASHEASIGEQTLALPDSSSYWFRVQAVNPSYNIASEVSNVVGEANDDWNLSFSDLPSSGSYQLTVTTASGSLTTGNLNYNASASDIQNALFPLKNVGNNNVTVLGGSGYFMLNFSSTLGAEAVSVTTNGGDVIALSNVPTPHLTDAWVSSKTSSTYTFTLSWDQTPFEGTGQTSDIVHMYYSFDDVNWVDWGWTYAWAGDGPVTPPTEDTSGTYYFRIQAEASMGMGAISNTAEYVYPTSAPPTPQLTYLSSDDYEDGGNTYSEYEVFWNSSPYSASPDSHDSMYLYYSTDGETWTLWGSTAASEGGVEVSGLTAGQTYYSRVQAENVDTSSGYSNVLSG